MSLTFAFNLYRIQIRMIFGGKHRFRKEYNEALDVLNERGHWLYLYDRLDGPNGEQVCVALKKWINAYQAKKAYMCSLEEHALIHDETSWDELLSSEQERKRELHVLIYGKFTEGYHGYVSD